MGTVMGAKNLKALAVRGSLDIGISKPDEYRTYYLRTLAGLMKTKWVQALGQQGTPVLLRYSNALGFLSVRNNQGVTIGDKGPLLEAEALEPYSTGMIACFGSPVHCRHRFSMEEGKHKGTRGEGPEYASIGSLGTKLGNLDLENVLYATHLCNLYGLDTISTGSYLAWAMASPTTVICAAETRSASRSARQARSRYNRSPASRLIPRDQDLHVRGIHETWCGLMELKTDPLVAKRERTPIQIVV
jgi:aldehyde:ferredoxin oxidoreductase